MSDIQYKSSVRIGFEGMSPQVHESTKLSNLETIHIKISGINSTVQKDGKGRDLYAKIRREMIKDLPKFEYFTYEYHKFLGLIKVNFVANSDRNYSKSWIPQGVIVPKDVRREYDDFIESLDSRRKPIANGYENNHDVKGLEKIREEVSKTREKVKKDLE